MAENEQSPEPRKVTRERARIAKAERTQRAILMRKQGVSYLDIARAMDCSTSTVHGMVRRHIQDMPTETATELRAHLLERLEEVHRANAGRLD